jgi:hypothetical protein
MKTVAEGVVGAVKWCVLKDEEDARVDFWYMQTITNDLAVTKPITASYTDAVINALRWAQREDNDLRA